MAMDAHCRKGKARRTQQGIINFTRMEFSLSLVAAIIVIVLPPLNRGTLLKKSFVLDKRLCLCIVCTSLYSKNVSEHRYAAVLSHPRPDSFGPSLRLSFLTCGLIFWSNHVGHKS